MATNLVETIQKNLGFPKLQKIDPNSQETKEAVPRHSLEKLGQAAIPAVLTALYRYASFDEGGYAVLSNADRTGWLGIIFEGKEKTAIEKVARYAGVAETEAETAMKNIADETVMTIKRLVSKPQTPAQVRLFMSNQRHNILVHLPAALQMGDLLNQDSLDDRTNKMEGPVSSFMHKIENVLAENDKTKYP